MERRFKGLGAITPAPPAAVQPAPAPSLSVAPEVSPAPPAAVADLGEVIPLTIPSGRTVYLCETVAAAATMEPGRAAFIQEELTTMRAVPAGAEWLRERIIDAKEIFGAPLLSVTLEEPV